MSEKTDLKPCPFCGCTYVEAQTCPNGIVLVTCDNCKAEGPLLADDPFNKEQVIAAWNQRDTSRDDAWKAMAERLAESINQSLGHIDDGSREICIALNDGRIACELSNHDIAELLKSLQAYTALHRSDP